MELAERARQANKVGSVSFLSVYVVHSQALDNIISTYYEFCRPVGCLTLPLCTASTFWQSVTGVSEVFCFWWAGPAIASRHCQQKLRRISQFTQLDYCNSLTLVHLQLANKLQLRRNVTVSSTTWPSVHVCTGWFGCQSVTHSRRYEYRLCRSTCASGQCTSQLQDSTCSLSSIYIYTCRTSKNRKVEQRRCDSCTTRLRHM